MNLENFIKKATILLAVTVLGGAIVYLVCRNGALKLKDSSEKAYHLQSKETPTDFSL